MLNKIICQKCKKKWEYYDENHWKDGLITCPFWIGNSTGKWLAKTNVHGQPPKWCPYALEHVVSDQNVE